MREITNALLFCFIVLAIFDTMSFNGYYRKLAWDKVSAQVIWVTAELR